MVKFVPVLQLKSIRISRMKNNPKIKISKYKINTGGEIIVVGSNMNITDAFGTNERIFIDDISSDKVKIKFSPSKGSKMMIHKPAKNSEFPWRVTLFVPKHMCGKVDNFKTMFADYSFLNDSLNLLIPNSKPTARRETNGSSYTNEKKIEKARRMIDRLNEMTDQGIEFHIKNGKIRAVAKIVI